MRSADRDDHSDRDHSDRDHSAWDAAWNGARLTVDARGRRCPLPIIELARRIRDIDVGADLQLWADDPAAAHDVPAWCRMRAQELISTRELADGGTAYLVHRLS
ncbi:MULTISPECIES: sulfurtransferase TusA family protein [unclassified Frankia]|uniref:sulfurtransferase TusA family protein n=1 Tax=unclassified Frankia TaxID=2632575 RepID=UPI002AD3EDE2|nr:MULTISPECIES: sulfurtransferase TusA family protein [unclassified Frankia]